MQPDIVRLTVRQLLSRGRLLALGGVVLLPPLLAVLYAASDSTETPDRALTRLCDGLVLTVVLPLLALILGSAALGNEVEDGTLIYLLMKPVRRPLIVISKLAPTVLIVAVLCALSVLVATLFTGRDSDTLRVGLSFIVAGAVAALAYCAVFILLGLVTTRTLVFGLLYIFLWEGALTALFKGLRWLSIREYARGIAKAIGDLSPNLVDAQISAAAAVAAVVAVVAISFILASRRLDAMDVD
jgi:ABC-2 type transport system permease protein